MARNPIAFVLKGYPRLSETFIAQEIRSLERLGFDLRIYSLRRPTDHRRHTMHDAIRAPVHYLPEYLHQAPLRVWRGWRAARRLYGYGEARRTWLADLKRDPTLNRVRRFGQACVLAAELADEIAHLHAHFLHTPASVARYAALMRGLTWSVSGHAKDIWTTPDWELREKLAAARWVVTCSRAGQRRLDALLPAPRVALSYHGIDHDRFPPPPNRSTGPDGGSANNPVSILSVGRAVPKKGYGSLLSALARLPVDLHWRFEHVGGGPDLPRLKRAADRLGLSARITWYGAKAQSDVLAAYRRTDLFVLASRIAGDGDRDGLPNVLMEAQSQGLACIATDLSAIPELIENGVSGVLVAPGDAAALATAIARLARDPAQRAKFGAAGRERVARDFDHQRSIAGLAELFERRI